MSRVLVLGGTGEAARLAGELTERGVGVTSSLAGRVRDPRLPAGRSRIGGFGGADGLAEWLRDEGVDALVDATHPFAAKMTDSAARASAATGVPLVVLRRPGWSRRYGDDWRWVPSLPAAASALSTNDDLGTRVFLTTGRQGLAAFAELYEHWFLVRAVETPEPPHPERMTTVLDRGPFTRDGELALLREHRIDCVVTKNSGGEATSAKLDAARELGLPVVMVARPPEPDVPVAETVADALAWIDAHLPEQG